MPTRKCEAGNCEIEKGRRAYAVSCPGTSKIYLVSHDGLAKNVSRELWNKETGYKVLAEGQVAERGLNFHKPIIRRSGELELGELRFSVRALDLRAFPGLYRLYFKWPWEL